MKTCKKCLAEKPQTDFYERVVRCKECCKKANKESLMKKINGEVSGRSSIKNISEEMRKNISHDIGLGIKYTVIAKKYEIPYQTFCYWHKKGFF